MTPEEEAAAIAEIDRIVSASTRLATMIGVNYKLDPEKLKSFPGGQAYLDRLTSPPSASARKEAERIVARFPESPGFDYPQMAIAIASALEKRDREIERLRSMPDRREHEYLSDERLQAAEAKLARAREALKKAWPILSENAPFLRDIQADALGIERAFAALKSVEDALTEIEAEQAPT